jgi:hypothetical protein
LRNRHLSSPPLELNELEEGSSEYSGVSRNSSRLQSSTPERFLYLDDSSSEEEGEEYEEQAEKGGGEGDRRGSSDMDSVFIVERSSSPEMRITVPGKGEGGGKQAREKERERERYFIDTLCGHVVPSGLASSVAPTYR